MIIIKIPSNNIEERSYAVKIVFDVFLGLKYDIKVESRNTTIIEWDNKAIIICDSFWNKGGISIQNLPVVTYSKTDYILEEDIPVLYGDGYIKKKDNIIDCSIDVFASIFFMLTRWEEYVDKERDKANRYIGKNSIAYRNGFLHRPVVNEYVEMIWEMMISLGYKEKRKVRNFEIVPTHDIDHPFVIDRFRETSFNIKKAIISKDLKSIPIYIKDYFVDSYNTYSFLMDVSERAGIKSHFYFMSTSAAITEYKESPYLTKHYIDIVNSIRKRGHIVGIHPGFFSVLSNDKWEKEKIILEKFIGITPVEGRQHFLRFSIPETFSFWEKNKMEVDSTLSYHDVEGFRCGTGDSFPVYNFIEKKEYKLKERPLILMDATLINYQGYSLKKISETLDYYMKVGEKYHMPITLLFHNSIFIGYVGKKIKKIYSDLLLKYKSS